MQEKFLKQSFEFVVGNQAEELVKILKSDKFVNEFLIAKKLGIEINQTRNLLYKLSDNGLVEFTRKKDKKKGWYTYFWGIELTKSLTYLKNIFEKRIDQFVHQIKSRESKVFYVCENCSIEYTEESALQHDFTCQECGNVFVLKDNFKVIKELKKNLDRYMSDMELLNIELDKLKKSDEKKRIKEAKKEQKIAKKKREEKKLKKISEKKLNEKIKKPKKEIKKSSKSNKKIISKKKK